MRASVRIVLAGRKQFSFASGSLPTGATLTRGSAGYRVNSSGVLVSESSNVARFDYDAIANTLRGLLIEPARTNSAPFSRVTTDSSLSGTGGQSTKSNPAQADPFAGTSGALFTADGTSNSHIFYVSATISYTSGTPVVISQFLRAGTASIAQLTGPGSAFPTNAYANFSLTGAGSVTATGAGVTATNIQQFSGGWYLCEIVAAPNATTSSVGPVVAFITSGSDTRLPTNASTSTLYATGGEVVPASAPSSFIDTPSSGAVTRAADVLTLNWASKAIADSSITARYTFDDLSTQDVATTVSSGTSTVPTNLNRSRILRVAKV